MLLNRNSLQFNFIKCRQIAFVCVTEEVEAIEKFNYRYPKKPNVYFQRLFFFLKSHPLNSIKVLNVEESLKEYSGCFRVTWTIRCRVVFWQ